MTATAAAVTQVYLAECEDITRYGVSVLDEAEVTTVLERTTVLGEHLLGQMIQAAWELRSADRAVRDAAAQLEKAATGITAAVDEHQRVPAGIDGITWVMTYASKVQAAVDRRQAIVDKLVELTWMARKVVEG